jgi:asparagine synthetase B (glutamine-hydrolysing)
MLCFNGLLERCTIIQDVHKILDGHFLKIDLKNLDKKEIQYFTTFNEGCFSGSKKKASQIIHEIFKESVLMEYSKDTVLGKNHLSLLSGGLDSRVAMMYALKNNQSIENVLCFSQSGYIDHTVSRKIAEDYRLHYEFIPLNGGKFLKKIDELTQISEGMVMYTGGIHVNHAVDEMQYENFALFHSGQLGDALLGGYLSAPERKRPSNYKIVGNPQFLGKVETLLNETKKNYESEESFLIRNRGYNTVLLGAHVFQQKRYQTSPFMAKDFLKFAAALPEEWKFNHRFYLEWIQKHCKEATKYRWERTLLKPDANWKTSFGDKFVKRSFKLLNEKILKTPQKSSMYPYQYYFDNDTEIQNYYKNYFEDNIHRIEDYKELESDVKELFQSENFYSKSQSVNILAIFKLFF